MLIYKTTTYALMHVTVAILVAYAVTRSWAAAIAIGLLEPAVQTVAYFFHEKLWQRHQPTAETTAATLPPRAHLHGWLALFDRQRRQDQQGE